MNVVEYIESLIDGKLDNYKDISEVDTDLTHPDVLKRMDVLDELHSVLDKLNSIFDDCMLETLLQRLSPSSPASIREDILVIDKENHNAKDWEVKYIREDLARRITGDISSEHSVYAEAIAYRSKLLHNQYSEISIKENINLSPELDQEIIHVINNILSIYHELSCSLERWKEKIGKFEGKVVSKGVSNIA